MDSHKLLQVGEVLSQVSRRVRMGDCYFVIWVRLLRLTQIKRGHFLTTTPTTIEGRGAERDRMEVGIVIISHRG